MKRIAILLSLLFNIVLLYSQDKEPNALLFRWGYDDINYRSFNIDSFKQDKVITGFQWSGSRKMVNAIKSNGFAVHGYQTDTANDWWNCQFVINQPTWMDRGGYQIGAWAAPFMQYEPSLPLTEENFGQILRPADSANPIFGFLERRGTISNNPSDSNKQ